MNMKVCNQIKENINFASPWEDTYQIRFRPQTCIKQTFQNIIETTSTLFKIYTVNQLFYFGEKLSLDNNSDLPTHPGVLFDRCSKRVKDSF